MIHKLSEPVFFGYGPEEIQMIGEDHSLRLLVRLIWQSCST